MLKNKIDARKKGSEGYLLDIAERRVHEMTKLEQHDVLGTAN